MKVYEAWLKICIVFILLWILFLLMLIKSKLKQEDIPNENLTSELISALLELNDLHKINSGLKHRVMVATKKLNIINKQNNAKNKQSNGPPEEYELLRRRIYSNTKEFWYYVSFELRSLETELNDFRPFILQMKATVDEHYRSLISDVIKLANVDGHSYWRQTELHYLSTVVKKRLRFLQNPQDCSKVKKLACNFIADHRPCGFCCRLHHLVNCMIVAYASRRLLVLDNPVNWRFTSGGFTSLFFPLSSKCMSLGNNETVLPWPGNENVQVVNLSLPVAVPDDGPNHLERPLTQPFNLLLLPDDLGHRINVVHSDPAVWWISQFVNYVVRPQLPIYDTMADYKDDLNFKNRDFPPICVHIRRVDVIGSPHKLDEYMYQLHDYIEKRKLNGMGYDIKQVYFSTDDPTLFEEAKNMYPNYEILGHPYLSENESVTTRELDESIMNAYVNVMFLSRCAFLVCSLSSHICRLAYEIINGLKLEDSPDRVTSMDDEYYFNDLTRKRYVAVLPHKANGPQEMDLQVGDEIEVFGNQRNGYLNGTHLRTNKTLLYPTFKVTQKIEVMTFPSYSDIKINVEEYADE